MKKLFFVLAALFVGNYASLAQKNLEKASEETCDCLTKANPPESISQDEYQKLITNCLTEPLTKYYEKICKEIKVNPDGGTESYETVGTKIGVKLADNCPVFLKLAMNTYGTKEESAVTETAPEETGVTGSSSGTIKSIDKKDFYYITLETNGGKKESFIWLRYFKGSAPFENNPAAQEGKKATVKYREIRCFSPELGDYAIKKEIIEVQLED